METFIGPIPCISAIIALDKAISCTHKAIPSRGIEAIGRKLMHGQSMRIEGSIGFSIFPGLPAVERLEDADPRVAVHFVGQSRDVDGAIVVGGAEQVQHVARGDGDRRLVLLVRQSSKYQTPQSSFQPCDDAPFVG